MDQTQTANQTEISIHPATLMGPVALTVANLENQIAFYTQLRGFKLHWQDGNRASLGRRRAHE